MWVTLENEWFKEAKNPDRCTKTGQQVGTLDIELVKTIKGTCNENRQWEMINGKKYFGNYIESDWYEFLEDIKTNGLKWPITIDVEADGSISVYEGNHRVQAFIQLEYTAIPVEVRYWANGHKVTKL